MSSLTCSGAHSSSWRCCVPPPPPPPPLLPRRVRRWWRGARRCRWRSSSTSKRSTSGGCCRGGLRCTRWLGEYASAAARPATLCSAHLPIFSTRFCPPASPASRDSPDPTPRELKQAVKLLFAAAGIQHLSVERPHKGSGGGGSTSKGPEFLTASAVKLVLRNDTYPHVGALKELVYVYREGERCSVARPAPLVADSRCCAQVCTCSASDLPSVTVITSKLCCRTSLPLCRRRRARQPSHCAPPAAAAGGAGAPREPGEAMG